MNDITALAQRMKAAAEREIIFRDTDETSNTWQYNVTPENVLALVEALESRTVTVKLPEVRITIAESKLRNLTYQQLDAYNAGATRAAVKLSQVLAAAGIQVIEGEQKNG